MNLVTRNLNQRWSKTTIPLLGHELYFGLAEIMPEGAAEETFRGITRAALRNGYEGYRASISLHPINGVHDPYTDAYPIGARGHYSRSLDVPGFGYVNLYAPVGSRRSGLRGASLNAILDDNWSVYLEHIKSRRSATARELLRLAADAAQKKQEPLF